MTLARPELVVCGDVFVAATPRGLERAEAIGIAGGRVVSVGTRRDILQFAGPAAVVHDVGDAAVIPGLQDFHIHLAGLARARAALRLDDAADAAEVAGRIRQHAAPLGPADWLTGRGWTEAQLRDGLEPLRDAAGTRAVYLSSHDGHSAWASPAALAAAGVSAATPDPAGGRVERDEHGVPTGMLRETALDLVAGVVPRLTGASLRPHLQATLAELAAWGITGASEAGDSTAEGGFGPDAAFGDSYSTLTDLADLVDGRLRMTLGIPVDALPAASARGMATGMPLAGLRTLRFGWAKSFADGALGSGTAALFEPASCGDESTGILRMTDGELDEVLRRGRRSRIALAIHAIGDRAAGTVLDAIERAKPRVAGVPADRIEHLQLVRGNDRRRLARLGVTASIQPIHAAADRDLVERCWQGRQADAYAWRSLLDAGALLAAGSDAPVETANPWLGLFAAVHRRLPADTRADWRPAEALSVVEALAAWTIGPATALGLADEGHLRPGARADLAALDVPIAGFLAADERLAAARSVLTIVDGRIVHEG